MRICQRIQGNELSKVTRIANDMRMRSKKQWAFYADFAAFTKEGYTYLVGYFRPIIDLTYFYFFLISCSLLAYFFLNTTWPLYLSLPLLVLIYINRGNWPQFFARRMLKKEGFDSLLVDSVGDDQAYMEIVAHLAGKK